MREFYQRLADWTLAAQALSGTSAFVALLPQNPNALFAKVATAIVATASILDLVFRFSSKAERHDRLCRQFTELAAEMAEWPATAKSLSRARAHRTKIEVDEPTERRLIDLRAHNDECSARGVDREKLLPLNYWQRSWLAYLFTFGEEGIRERMADRQRHQP